MRRCVFVLCLAAVCLQTLWAAGTELGALVDANRWRKARPIADAAVKANANDADAAYQLARIKMNFGDLDGALPLAERAAAMQPKQAPYRVLVAQVVGRQAQQASMFRQVSIGRRVKREAEAALALDANSIDALEILREFYLQAPGIIGGDKAQAAAMLKRIKALSPADGFLQEAEEAADAKQTARVGDLYRAAVAANASHARARRTLTNYLLLPESRNLAEAETHARELVKLAPDRADSYAALAFALAGLKKFAELDAALSAAEAGIPENLYPLYRAGNGLLAAEADLPRAERYFRRYVSQEIEAGFPSHGAAYWRLGLVLEKQGRKADAIAAIRQAVGADPNLDAAKADLKRLQR